MHEFALSLVAVWASERNRKNAIRRGDRVGTGSDAFEKQRIRKTDCVMRMVFIDRKFPSCYPYFIKAFGVDVARSFFGSAHAWNVCRAYFYIAREKVKEDRKR